MFPEIGKGRDKAAKPLTLSLQKGFCNDRGMDHATSPLALILLLASPFVGSFLGLLIDRLPVGDNVIIGRSRCRACGAKLGPLDLVPVVSWVASGGRCRHCSAPLGWFHPAVELAAVGVALWSVLVMPNSLILPTAALGWALLVLAVIDHRHMLLPDVVNLPLIPAGLAVAAFVHWGGLLDSMIGVAAGAASLGAVGWAYHKTFGREGLGLGDVKLFAAAGAWVGWQGLASVLLIGATTSLVAAVIFGRIHGGGHRGAPVAFGPGLAIGLWITWLYGPVSLMII